MDEQLQAELKERLVAEQQRLREELGTVATKEVHGNDAYGATFPDLGDEEDENAQEVASFQDRMSVEGGMQHTLTDVDDALAKMEAGTYGKCETCGKAIDVERLKVMPSARFCEEHMGKHA